LILFLSFLVYSNLITNKINITRIKLAYIFTHVNSHDRIKVQNVLGHPWKPEIPYPLPHTKVKSLNSQLQIVKAGVISKLAPSADK
jgi:hypothetical protein